MYLYNITFAADAALEKELLEWLAGDFLTECAQGPEAVFSRPGIFRVMNHAEPGTVSLAVHMYAESLRDIEDWYGDCGNRLFADALARWGQRVVFFPTTLEGLV